MGRDQRAESFKTEDEKEYGSYLTDNTLRLHFRHQQLTKIRFNMSKHVVPIEITGLEVVVTNNSTTPAPPWTYLFNVVIQSGEGL
jgi:hypothetical protein